MSYFRRRKSLREKKKNSTMKRKTVIKITCLDLEEGGIHLILKIKINGKIANMVLDTGASKTVFDRTRFERFVSNAELKKNAELSAGVGTNTMETHSVVIKKIRVGELIIKDYDAAIMDLSHVNQAYDNLGMKPTDGILGSDILYAYDAIIDYGKMELKLSF